MATLILGSIGRAIGGPFGGLVGTFLGSALDRSLLGGGKHREAGRLSNLAVQSSAYGEPIPRLYGTMRVAGNLVWTAGIAEHSSSSGGGKRGGAKTTSYTYSSSFAVILAARPVAGIGRVWADGKLLRDATGAWITPATMRLHTGGDGQAVDPLIAAAEGAGGAPAYRGLAYAVFEDLPLADYGNRIPNLTFELIADAEGTGADAIVADLCAAANIEGVAPAGTFPSFSGFAAAQGGSVREQLGQLADLYDLRFVDDGELLGVRAGPVAATVTLAADDLGSHDASSSPHEARSEARGAAGQLDDAVALAFHDPARDYQPGLQRAVRRADASRVAQVDIAAAFAADTAKGLAGALLARRNAARVGATFQLPCRSLGLRAGTAVRREGDATAWSIRRWTFANFVSELAVERQPIRLATAAVADPGRVHDAGDSAAGPTVLHLLDLPPLFGDALAGPRLYVAGAGASPGWRRSGVALSLDGGETYAAVGDIGAPSVIGATVSVLAAGSGDRWDRSGRFEVELLGSAMWLEGRSGAVVLAGANLAVVDDEVIQFAAVEALGSRRFALSGLLRGRRGSAVAIHAPGARFVLLDPERLLALDLGPEVVGRSLRVRATGAGDGSTPAVSIAFAGNAARPLPPVFLRCSPDGGDALFGWKRRGRSGFAWLDGVDAPLGESSESYRVELRRGVTVLRAATVATPAGATLPPTASPTAREREPPWRSRSASSAISPACPRAPISSCPEHPEAPMSELTDRYALPLLQVAQAQKEVTHNEAVAGIDALLHLSVETATLGVPPASPTVGQAWIVAPAAAGTWAGHAGEVASFGSAGWRFIVPREGCVAWLRDLQHFAVRTGTGWRDDGWPAAGIRIGARLALGVTPVAVGLPTGGTIVDLEARTAITVVVTALRSQGVVA